MYLVRFLVYLFPCLYYISYILIPSQELSSAQAKNDLFSLSIAYTGWRSARPIRNAGAIAREACSAKRAARSAPLNLGPCMHVRVARELSAAPYCVHGREVVASAILTQRQLSTRQNFKSARFAREALRAPIICLDRAAG